jgi:peroxiredoxin
VPFEELTYRKKGRWKIQEEDTMKIIYLIILQALVLSGFSQNSFLISGTITGDYSDFIYLNYGKTKDSVKIIDNKFEFKGHVERPIQGWLNLKPNATIAWLYIENSNIDIEADYERREYNGSPINFLRIKNIKGSYSANIQKDYQEFFKINKANEKFDSLLYSKLQSFLRENKSHSFGGKILSDLALTQSILSRSQLIELYALIDTTQQNAEDIRMFKQGIANLNKYDINKPFAKFSLTNPSEEEISIESFLGKIVLIDFWASWCAPCRAKHPELIKLNNRFKHDNFAIVSISIDDSKTSWLNAIEKDSLTWTNLFDAKKEVSKDLGISVIPFNYLISKDGNILGINLSTEQIYKLVAKEIKD